MHLKSEQINELATALAKAQMELTAVAKDAKGYGINTQRLTISLTHCANH